MKNGRKRWFICLSAFVAGIASFLLYQRDLNGRISTQDVVVAAITLMAAIGIVLFVGRLRSRTDPPEPGTQKGATP